MRKMVLILTAAMSAVVAPAVSAKPRGTVPGRFTVGILAQTDELSRYLRASNVFCVWRGDHVVVHVNLKNRAIEHVTATVKPRYFIARGGEHGSGFTSATDFGFDAGEFRALWIDAGKPEGVSPGSTIERCAPYLYLIKSG